MATTQNFMFDLLLQPLSYSLFFACDIKLSLVSLFVTQLTGNILLASLWCDFATQEEFYMSHCILVIALVGLTLSIILCLIFYIADIRTLMCEQSQIIDQSMDEGVLIAAFRNKNYQVKYVNKVAKRILCKREADLYGQDTTIEKIEFIRMTEDK